MEKSGQRKRILIVCQHFWPESFRINDIADFLANEKNCEVEVLCGLPNYPSGKLFKGYSLFGKRKDEYKGIPIHRVLEIPRGNNSNIRIFLNYVSFPFFSLFHIPRLLTKYYDEVFLYQLSPVMMSVVGIIVGKIKRIPITMYVLDLWPENLYSVLPVRNVFIKRMLFLLSSWHYKHADRLIALSESMKKRLLEVTNKIEQNITIIPQTCEKIYEEEIVDHILTKRFKDTFNIVYTGNISPAQSIETIVEAAEVVVGYGIHDVRWLIIGDGMSKKAIQNLVESKGMSPYFIFEGQKRIEDIPKYTYIADALIGTLAKSNLLEATIPAKIVSYMASGKPLLLAMDGEVQELINYKSKSGYAGAAGDAGSLASNIKRMYNLTKEQRKTLGDNAKDYYLKNFERNLVLTKIYNFILKVSQ